MSGCVCLVGAVLRTVVVAQIELPDGRPVGNREERDEDPHRHSPNQGRQPRGRSQPGEVAGNRSGYRTPLDVGREVLQVAEVVTRDGRATRPTVKAFAIFGRPPHGPTLLGRDPPRSVRAKATHLRRPIGRRRTTAIDGWWQRSRDPQRWLPACT